MSEASFCDGCGKACLPMKNAYCYECRDTHKDIQVDEVLNPTKVRQMKKHFIGATYELIQANFQHVVQQLDEARAELAQKNIEINSLYSRLMKIQRQLKYIVEPVDAAKLSKGDLIAHYTWHVFQVLDGFDNSEGTK